MNIPSLTPRDMIEVVLKRKWLRLFSLAMCMDLAHGGGGKALGSLSSKR
jgi:hypothetical protein